MKKDIDTVFDALVATANYVTLKRAVVQPIIVSGGTTYVVTLTMEPIVCTICSKVSDMLNRLVSYHLTNMTVPHPATGNHSEQGQEDL